MYIHSIVNHVEDVNNTLICIIDKTSILKYQMTHFEIITRLYKKVKIYQMDKLSYLLKINKQRRGKRKQKKKDQKEINSIQNTTLKIKV